MTYESPRSPLAAGLSAALRHVRLAVILWLSLVVSAGIVYPAVRRFADALDQSPFRETLMQGWDSWGMLSLLVFRNRELESILPVFVVALVASALLQLFLTGGIARTLIADIPKPAFRRVIAESAALFKPSLWAFARFGVTLVLWESILVGIPVRILTALAGGDDAAPNVPLKEVAELWAVIVGTIVFLNVLLRFDLARIALARGDAPTARGAYRVAKERLRDSRVSAFFLLLGWLVLGVAVQALFTNLGIAMNPKSDGGVTALVVFRQLGFIALAMVRVGFWASLLAWERARRVRPVWTLQAVAA